MVNFLKVLDVKSPIRKEGNVGFDFFVPEYNDEFNTLFKAKNPDISIEKPDSKHEFYYMRVAPHTSICIPSGIKSSMPDNEVLIAFNKSGIALLRHLDTGACVIDPSYQGMLHMHLTNTSNDYIEISCGDKITQFLPFFFDNENGKTFEKDEISEKDFFGKESERGAGAVGSTSTR